MNEKLQSLKATVSASVRNSETGGTSWTAVGVFISIVWFLIVHITVFIYLFIREAEVSEGALQWSLASTAQLISTLFVRGARDVARYWGTDFISGSGSVSKKKVDTSKVDTSENVSKKSAEIKKEISEQNKKTVTTKPKEAKQAVKSKHNQESKPISLPNGNFDLIEFQSKDKAPMPAAVKRNILKLIEQLEVIRAEAGGRPIKITSGYRSPAYNAKTKGAATDSQHMKGKAADMRIEGMKPSEVRDLIKRLMDEKRIIPGGLKAYPTFTHYDIRGKYVTWKN